MKKVITPWGLLFTLTLFTHCASAATVSDLLISEVMANPSRITDTRGEWFELYNPTATPVNLRGIDLGDDGSNRHRFDTDLLILPGEYFTLARSAAPGFIPDYVYDDFTLSNAADEIVFRDGALELLRLDYGPGFAVAGRSRQLQSLPATAANYGLALAVLDYGLGDLGTPGSGEGLPGAPAAVPLPAAIWLFSSAVLACLLPRRRMVRFQVLPSLRSKSRDSVPGADAERHVSGIGAHTGGWA